MPKYSDDYYLTPQEIDELSADAKQVSKVIAALFRFETEIHYSYRVEWAAESAEYIGLCEEFPSLSWINSDQDKARLGIEKLVFEVVKDMIIQGENIPEMQKSTLR
ncbi:antitoxin HicB [Acinetobacter kookii]